MIKQDVGCVCVSLCRLIFYVKEESGPFCRENQKDVMFARTSIHVQDNVGRAILLTSKEKGFIQL